MPTTLNGENGVKEEEPDKKSKERREKDRKALRMRRINSLKRQISIKEKMLEVGGVDLLIIYFCPRRTRNYNKPLTFLIIAYTCCLMCPTGDVLNVSTNLIFAKTSKLSQVESNCNSFQKFRRVLEGCKTVCGRNPGVVKR